MVTASRLAWIRKELTCGRQSRVKLHSFTDKIKLTITLLPFWHADMKNLPAIAFVDYILNQLHNVVAMDHGHANSAGESIVAIYMKPAPVKDVQLVTPPTDPWFGPHSTDPWARNVLDDDSGPVGNLSCKRKNTVSSSSSKQMSRPGTLDTGNKDKSSSDMDDHSLSAKANLLFETFLPKEVGDFAEDVQGGELDELLPTNVSLPQNQTRKTILDETPSRAVLPDSISESADKEPLEKKQKLDETQLSTDEFNVFVKNQIQDTLNTRRQRVKRVLGHGNKDTLRKMIELTDRTVKLESSFNEGNINAKSACSELLNLQQEEEVILEMMHSTLSAVVPVLPNG